MMQRLDSVREQFLANLNLLQRRMAITQNQLSSGLRISKASDDPSSVTDVLQLEFDTAKISQTITNLNNTKGEVNTAESALQSVSSLLDQARSLGAQGASSTATASGRKTIGDQVEGILSQIVAISRTTYQGRFVFSGDKAGSPSYQLNLSSATGVDQLLTASSTRQAQDFNGVTFGVSKTAAEIFDHRNSSNVPDASNVFAAVNSLRVALNNNDQTGITSALSSLSSAADYFQTQLSFYGSTQNRIQSSLDLASQYQVQSAAALSQVRDTDVAAAATDLTQENLSQQAALQAQANLPRTSLFDYLK
jgi:flagellar hook-associated protein 3 FlgL